MGASIWLNPGGQRALQDAYEVGSLRGKKLIAAKKLVEDRRRRGKMLDIRRREGGGVERLSSEALLRAYEEDVARKRDLIRRLNAANERLVLIAEALCRLSRDEKYVSLVEDE